MQGSGGGAGTPFFEACPQFEGARPGTVFKLGHLGLGYYLDTVVVKTALPEVQAQLPERWRDCTLREERLHVDPQFGAGLSLAHNEFGFLVEGVDPQPGQQLQPGDLIVAVEGRLFVGLSAQQMQASFQKRRVEGARLQVAFLEEVKRLAARDPAIVECWDPVNRRPYYIHKKTGQSRWTIEEFEQGQSNVTVESEPQGAPVDLSTFLSHGFAKPKEPPKKKRKAPLAAQAEKAEPEKDESDLAREERQRWSDWNEGGRGGYTASFLERYRNCTSNPGKKHKDKRLQGSVGPGQGMEYMAKWTGSKNSFN